MAPRPKPSFPAVLAASRSVLWRLGVAATVCVLWGVGTDGSAHAQDELTPAERPASELAVPPPPSQDSPDPSPTGAPSDNRDGVRFPIPGPDLIAPPTEEQPTIRIPSRITTRLRALDANLRALAARGGGNIVNAVLSLLSGGLSITLGALTTPNDDAMSIYLYVYGGTQATRGILEFLLTPDASGAAITYEHMPIATADDVRARLRYGEEQLAALAERSLIARVLDASLNMAAGVAVVPVYLAPNDFEIGEPLDYFLLIGAGVAIVSGIITLASTSAAEQRWSAYQQLRDRLQRESESEEDDNGDDEMAAFVPSPQLRLGFGSLSLQF